MEGEGRDAESLQGRTPARWQGEPWSQAHAAGVASDLDGARDRSRPRAGSAEGTGMGGIWRICCRRIWCRKEAQLWGQLRARREDLANRCLSRAPLSHPQGEEPSGARRVHATRRGGAAHPEPGLVLRIIPSGPRGRASTSSWQVTKGRFTRAELGFRRSRQERASLSLACRGRSTHCPAPQTPPPPAAHGVSTQVAGNLDGVSSPGSKVQEENQEPSTYPKSPSPAQLVEAVPLAQPPALGIGPGLAWPHPLGLGTVGWAR